MAQMLRKVNEKYVEDVKLAQVTEDLQEWLKLRKGNYSLKELLCGVWLFLENADDIKEYEDHWLT